VKQSVLRMPYASKWEQQEKERERERTPIKILSSGRESNQDLTDKKQESSSFSAEFRMRGITSPPLHTYLLCQGQFYLCLTCQQRTFEETAIDCVKWNFLNFTVFTAERIVLKIFFTISQI
jgi:hypothetical protein